MWELNHKEGWMLKNWCFWIVVLERLLRVPWTTWRWNQSILTEISPENSLEGLILKLKLQYFGHLIRRANSLEKTLILGKIEGRKRRGQQRMRWLDGIIQLDGQKFELGVGGWTGKPGVLQSMRSQRVRHDWATELNWTELRHNQWNSTMFVLSCLPYSPLHSIFKVHHVLAYVRNFLIFKAK